MYVCATYFFLVSNMSYNSLHGIKYKYTKVIVYSVPPDMYYSFTVLMVSTVTSGFYCYKRNASTNSFLNVFGYMCACMNASIFLGQILKKDDRLTSSVLHFL